MPITLNITITLPEGSSVEITEQPAEASGPEPTLAEVVANYWDRLSDNGQRIFAAAARIENHAGPGFTLDDIAENLSITYESAKSMHRTAGRTARKWREDTGTEPPVDLVDMGEYGWKKEHGGDRTSYRLPEGIAEIVSELAMA
jgi:hypothetical protein